MFSDDAEQRLRRAFARCPLPDHDGAAHVVRDDDGELRLQCCGGRLRSLGEVRAGRAYGHDRVRSNIEIAVWTRRLAWELGCFAPVDVDLMPADGLGRTTRKVLSGFGALCGLRWADYERRPVSYSRKFAAAWCDVIEWEAREALNALSAGGWIVPMGKVADRTPVYLPGPVAWSTRMREMPAEEAK